MTDNILEKAKKRRMSAYVHANLNKPIDAGALQLIENTLARANAAEISTEDDSVGKGKSRKRITYNVSVCPDGSHTGMPAAGGGASMGPANECADAQVDKMNAREIRFTGVPEDMSYHGIVRGSAIQDMFSPTGDYAQRRGDTMPLTAGHAAESAASNLNPSGMANGLAVGHIDLRNQSTPRVTGPTVTVHSVNGDNTYGDRDITHSTGSATINRFDANQHAGSYGGMRMPSGLPASPVSHQHRDSATPDNGSHDLSNPTAPPRQSMKAENMSRLDIMRATQRKMG